MKIVSNTSPLCYLLLIGQIELLPALFGEIVIPETVRTELADEDAPNIIRDWIKSPPEWLRVKANLKEIDPSLSRLHAGEQAAIMLAQNLKADLIILDEKVARQVAKEQGLSVTGLLGILDEAATRDLVDLPVAVERLRQTSFRIAPRMLKVLLDKHYGQGS